VFLQDNAGGFQIFADYPTANAYKICVGDFNHDGLTDVAGIGWSSGQVDVFPQRLDGTLLFSAQFTANYGGYNDLKSGDVNGDGLADIVVMSGQSYAIPNLGVLLQTNGGFAPVSYYRIGPNQTTTGMGIGDVNGDGRNDIVVSYGGNRPYARIGVFLQQPSGMLSLGSTNASYDIPEPVVIADVDLDGRQDVVTLHGGWQRLGIYFQTSLGSLATEQLYSIPYASDYNLNGLAIGDVNGDGMPDAVIADYNHGLVVLTNRPAPPAFQIRSINITPDGKISLSIPYRGGKDTCTVQASDNPAGTNWAAIGLVTGASWIDTNSPSGQPGRFYRLLAK